MNLHRDENNTGTNETNEPQSMSLLNGIGKADAVDAELDFEQAQGGRRQLLGQSTLLVGLVVAIAIGSLYAMRMTQGAVASPQGDQLVDAKMEQMLIKLANPDALEPDSPLAAGGLTELFRDTDAIIAMLSSDFASQQVPAEYIKKNPFVLPQRQTQAVAAPDDSRSEARLRRLQSEAGRLRLKTVMGGPTPVAIINDDMVRQGQPVGSFILKSIDVQSQTVTLTSGEDTFTLQMQD